MSKKLYMGLVPLLAVVAFAMAPAAAQAKQCTTSSAVIGPCPHFLLANKAVTATPAKTLAWGTLTLTSAAGTISCSNAVLAREFNPAVVKPPAWVATTKYLAKEVVSEGGVDYEAIVNNENLKPSTHPATWLPVNVGDTGGAAGKDETLAFGSGECVDETCPGVGYVQPTDLPWPSELIENGKGEVQDESYNVHVIIGCENPLEKANVTEGEKGYTPNGGKVLGALEFTTNAENKQTPTALNTGTSGCSKPSEIEFGAESGHLSALGGAVIGTTSGNLKICGYEKQSLSTTTIN